MTVLQTRRSRKLNCTHDTFSHNILLLTHLSTALECLRRVAAWTLDINRSLQPVNVVNFNAVFTIDVVTRLRKIKAISRLGSVINLATADPQLLQPKLKFITMIPSKEPGTTVSLVLAPWRTVPYLLMTRAIKFVFISRIAFSLGWLLYLAVSCGSKHCTWDPIITVFLSAPLQRQVVFSHPSILISASSLLQ